jgi:serine/threonine protein kinase
MYNTGGKVLASGGFGCVFSPALKCQGVKKREDNKISKLMTERHATEEYEEINNIKEKLKDIPDYQDYFLLKDINICKPAKLTKKDIINFKTKCTALPKDGITKDNINYSLDKVMVLNMPNGGIPVDDFIYEKGSFKKIRNVNISLMDLLVYGIVPMNQHNIYHCDIKDSNVLVDDNDFKLKVRLIDWGLSTEYIPKQNSPFPSTWRNRPFQFNVPFSVIIFSDDFVEMYMKYINEGGKINEDSLRPFVIDYIHYWIKERGPGHYRYINEIMHMLFSEEINNVSDSNKDTIIETDFTMLYITNYIINILVHFTKFRKNGTLNLREYLDNVFVKIVDIWGFITIYLPLLDFLYKNFDNLTDNEHEIYNLIKYMFIKYLYSPRIKPIKIDEIIFDLEKLDDLIVNNFSNVSRGLNMNENISIKKSTEKSKLHFKKKSKSKTKSRKLIMISNNNNKTLKRYKKIIKSKNLFSKK